MLHRECNSGVKCIRTCWYSVSLNYVHCGIHLVVFAGSCDFVNKPSVYVKCGECLDWLWGPFRFLGRTLLHDSEIIPTRCNNCVYSSQWLYSTCFGWQFHPSSGVQCCMWPLNTQHSEKQHGITRQCYLQLNRTDNDKTTRILTKLQHKYTCLPERPHTALYSWWWVELSPETCRVKPLRRINAIVASCWNYFTM